MKMITVLDTSISTDNLGDEIIMDAVYATVAEVFPTSYVSKVSTHDYMGYSSLKILSSSILAIVGGTNLLDSRMLSKHALWKLRSSDARKMCPVVLLATGWRGYSGPTDYSTTRILQKILSKDFDHSLRDSYSEKKANSVVKNTLNTACVTMWQLTPDRCKSIPTKMAKSVITTLTFYDKHPEFDKSLLEVLKSRYENVFFWPQQFQDMAYFDQLMVDGIHIIDPNTKAYSHFLETNDVDFVGTRLHGGIRALQKGRRALILAIDNRATEIGRDTNLPVIKRGELDQVIEWIEGEASTSINLPTDAISAWKGQFNGLLS